jgi:hypothetical protein
MGCLGESLCILSLVSPLPYFFKGANVKKLTAKVARRLSKNTRATVALNFPHVIKFLASEARNGHTNTFIDGDLKDLEVIKKELEERGFRCHIEQTGFAEFGTLGGPKFLSVEW